MRERGNVAAHMGCAGAVNAPALVLISQFLVVYFGVKTAAGFFDFIQKFLLQVALMFQVLATYFFFFLFSQDDH